MRSATKEPVVGEAALSILEGVTALFVAQGKGVLQVDLTKARPTDTELLDLLLGRSGKLRAPTIRVGSRLLVGYNEELLRTGLRS